MAIGPRALTPPRLGSALTAFGVLAVVGSWGLHDDGWLSGFLLEVGVTLFLLVPLLWATRRLEGQVQRTRDNVDQLQTQVEETRAELARTHEDISEQVAARFAAERAEDEAVFDALRLAPSREDVVTALRLAAERGWITRRGLRTNLFDTGFALRFRLTDEGDLVLRVEWPDGDLVVEESWPPGRSAIDVFEVLGKGLRERDQFPGEVAFQPGLSLEEAANTLTFSSQSRRLGEEVRGLLQVVGDDWCVGERGVEHTTRRYRISLARLDEMDWHKHMSGKPWVDMGNWGTAMEIARALHNGAFE
jgi:hypothetical protein